MSKWFRVSPRAQTVYRVLGNLDPATAGELNRLAKEALEKAKEKRLGKISSRGTGRE